MKQLICKVITGLLITITLFGCKQSTSNEKKVGVIVPIEHKAMDAIVAGFTETLNNASEQPVKIKVANAQGDVNIQRAIIQQMRDEGYNLIVPIGTATTQMTVAMVHTQPIVSVAANFYAEDRSKLNPCNITVVHDEISPKQIVAFIHKAYPKLKQLTLIHSAAEKIYPDVKVAVAAGKQLGIAIKPVMVPTLNELYAVANNLPAGTQGIFVLKDNLIVSGISTLSISAAKNHLPLITSDQGSVQDGAGFALGVPEKQIGVEGGKLAARVLAGTPACDIPMVDMTKLTVFINKDNLRKENQPIEDIIKAAKAANYDVQDASNKQ